MPGPCDRCRARLGSPGESTDNDEPDLLMGMFCPTAWLTSCCPATTTVPYRKHKTFFHNNFQNIVSQFPQIVLKILTII